MLVLNERDYAKYVLENGIIEKNPSQTISLLARYLKKEIKEDEQRIYDECKANGLTYRKKTNAQIRPLVQEKINNFFKEYYPYYTETKWKKIIRQIVINKNCSLRETEYIPIYKSELQQIDMLSSISTQKTFFTMLVIAKLYNLDSSTNNNWVNTNIKDIFKLANTVVKKSNQKYSILHELFSLGYIHCSNKNENLNMQISPSIIINQSDEEPILKIPTLTNLGYEYIRYRKLGYFRRCKKCNTLFRTKKYDRKSSICPSCLAKENVLVKINQCEKCGKSYTTQRKDNKSKLCSDCQKKHSKELSKARNEQYYHRIMTLSN